KADIYAPCALGATINDESIEKLKEAGVKVVAGSANNQLAEDKHGDILENEDIVYAPDYILNAVVLFKWQMNLTVVTMKSVTKSKLKIFITKLKKYLRLLTEIILRHMMQQTASVKNVLKPSKKLNAYLTNQINQY